MKIQRLSWVLGSTLVLAACGGGDSDDGGSSSSVASSSSSSASQVSSSSSESSSSSSPARVEPRANPTVNSELIQYNDVAVHDPSVFRDDDGTYYVVGSHLAMASSEDLITWTSEAPGIALENPDLTDYPLFGNYETEVAEGIEWTGGYVGSWASDIRKLADGKYYFYFNHCTNPASGVCDAPRSYLGLATSEDSIFGPYENQGIFLWSGQTDAEIDQGYGVGEIESYNGNIHPNAIDPHTFHDKDGNLWMIYGSYAGGIHILAMDESTGLPEPGQGYGKHLTGGDHSAIEGTFVLYSPETDYYYMFASFGGFVSTDGYNIRIARSRTPDGPYLDAEGNDMALARGGWDGIAPYGVKLMGGFNFRSRTGDDHGSRGYLAPGHNSAYYDEATGQHFLITHTRFPDRGEQHAIRVHELMATADGWLVASPHRYALIEGDNVVDSEDVVGDYQFINHGKDINREARQSQAMTLHDDGTITGEVTGTYQLDPEALNRIVLQLDGLGSYEGQLRWQWDERIAELVPAFSAVSGSGESVWGTRLPAQSTTEVLAAVAAELTLPETFKGDALTLPSDGIRGAQILWESSNEAVIGTDGQVERPAPGSGDASVSLTATILYQGEQETVTLEVLVPERMPFNRVARFEFENDLSDSTGQFEAAMSTGDRIHKVGEGNLSYTTGSAGQAVSLDGSSGVRFPDGLINNYEYTLSLWVRPNAITQFSPLVFGEVPGDASDPLVEPSQWFSFLPSSWDENVMLWSRNNDAWFDGATGETIPAGEWSHLAVSVSQGYVRVYIDGQQAYAGGSVADFFTDNTGRFALGVNYWDLPFNGLVDEFNVYDAALSAAEIQALDIDRLSTSELLGVARDQLTLGDTSAVIEDFSLPVSGPFATAVSWTSSDSAVVEVEGATARVTRPAASDADVTLTATLSLEGQSVTRDITVTVLSEGMPEPAARFSFDDHLDDATGNTGSGMVTGNRLDNTGGSLSFDEGRVGRALSLDGTYGVALPDNLITDATYTISVWLNPSALTQFTTAFFGAASADSWISVVPNGPGDGNTMLWSGTDWFDGDTGTQIPTGTWTHFVAVNNAGNLTLYLDGEAVFTGAGFPDVFTPAETTVFGVGVNYWDTPYDGLVDELSIYDVPLTAEDVAAIYSSAP